MSSADTFIGNYRVISQIFSDPFSRVYLAEHSYTTKRPVAVRLWHTVHFNSTQEYSAFLQEAQNLVTLSHPYVLPLIDLGVEVDSPYVVTEYIYTSMGSLRDRIRQQGQRPFQQQEAFSILSEAAQGLYQAHQQNILHRQLAPEHIIFNMRGEAILADFGLVSILNAPAVKKVDRFDTDPYAAPEQARGITTRQSDQYSLAAIAYELLTGYPPAQPLVPPRQINPSLSANVEQAILKGMAPEESNRYPDVGAFMVALFTPEGAEVVAAPAAPALDAAQAFVVSPAVAAAIDEGEETLISRPKGNSFTPVPEPVSAPPPQDHTVLAGPASGLINAQVPSPTPVLPPVDHTVLASAGSYPAPVSSTPLPGALPPVGPSPAPVFEDRTAAAQGTPSGPGWSYTGEQPFQPVPAFGAVQGGPAWASANTTANPVLNEAYGVPNTGYGSPPGGIQPAQQPAPNKKRRRNILIGVIAAVVVLALLIVLLGPYLYSIVPASSATVTLTPVTKSLSQTYTITAVPGTPDATKHQGQLRTVTFTTPAKTGSAKATGKGQGGPVSATGTLVFSQFSGAATFTAGLQVQSNSGVDLITDQAFNVQAGGSASVPAHAANTGPGGNIPALDVDNTFTYTDSNGATGTVVIQNPNAFTGGANSSTFTAVQQSDIDGVAKPVEPQLTTDAKTGAQKLVQTGEKLTSDFQCAPNVTSDHKAGDKADTVNVSVTVTCQAEAYTPSAIQQVASDWLKSDASTQFGTSYALAGNITDSAPKVTTTNTDGSAVFSVDAKGLFAYQFTSDQEHQFAQSIQGKTQSDSRSLLLKQEGVKDVSFNTSSFFGGAMPSSADNIKFDVAKVG